MKKFIVILGIFLTPPLQNKGLAQDNTFPLSGNVGIGSSSPDLRLVVNGNVRIDSTLIVQDSAVFQQRMRIMGEVVIDGFTKFKDDVRILGDARFKSDLRVDSTLRVDELLRVDGLTKLNGEVKMTGLESHTGDLASMEVVIKTPTGNLKTTTIGVLLDQTYLPFTCTPAFLASPKWSSGANKIYVECEPVNVGIGTSTPEHKLDVKGTVYGIKGLFGNTAASNAATLSVFTPNPVHDIVQFGKRVGSVEEVYFKITNEGKVWATEINVDVKEDFPDYVFADSYPLMGIENVEEFVEKNGHLPNMPSAKNVAQNGLNIAKFEVQQTEKIEELYLYMFEMNEQLKQLENEMTKLKDENTALKNQIETLK